VALKPSGSREPFFCVHAVLGVVFRYHHLALYLPEDRPFYGLQARGLDGTCEPHTRIEDMASEYVEAIRRVQPRGPYYLGGYSMGGLVAFEMAQQLVRAGERVAPVALLGTNAPMPTTRSLEFWFGYMESAQRLFSNTFKAYQTPFMQGQGPGRRPPSLPPPLRVAMACTRAAMRYRPLSYPGALDVFATAEQLAMCRADMTLGWRAFCTGRIDLHPVEGNHLSMIEEPAVRDAARKLTACLQRDAAHEPRV
jgi:thioesterase domain-containing protein